MSARMDNVQCLSLFIVKQNKNSNVTFLNMPFLEYSTLQKENKMAHNPNALITIIAT